MDRQFANAQGSMITMLAKRKALSANVVRELLDYKPRSGKLYWRQRPRHFFKSDHSCNAWNAKHAGKEAFTAYNDKKRGVRAGLILSKGYLAHHVIFLWMTGRWPEPEVDHEDGNPENNRWRNLKESTHTGNNRNTRRRKDNKSGHAGVYETEAGTFAVSIPSNNEWKRIGTFPTYAAAVRARKTEQRKLNFSERHGV